jgi:hypothetical protein
MSNSIVASQGLATLTLTAGQSIALNSLTETTVFEQVGFPNYPSQNDLEATFTGYTVLGPVCFWCNAGGRSRCSRSGLSGRHRPRGRWRELPGHADHAELGCHVDDCQGDVRPDHHDPDHWRTIAVLLPNGADMDLAAQFDVGEYFDWVLVNLSTGSNTVTITNAASGNNINGNAVVAITSSARFRTYKTAADTFATYRIA